MNNIIQMNQPDQLIPIVEHQGRNAVSLRELHEFLEVSKDFTNWAKAMFEYGFTENSDYLEVYAQKGENLFGGRPQRNWAVSLDMAKELSMIQRTEKGKQARQYFIEVEKRARASQAAKPKSLEEQAIELLGALQARVAEQAKELETVRPKADYADMISESEGLRTIGDLANDLKAHAAANHPAAKILNADVFELAGELDVIIRGNTVRHNQPTARAIDAKWARAHEVTYERKSGGTGTKRYTRITPRGYARIWEEAVTRLRNNQPIFTPKTKAA